MAIKIRTGSTNLQVYNIYRSQRWELDLSEHNNEAGLHLAIVLEEADNICLLNSGVSTHQAGGRLDLTFVSRDLGHCSKWWIHPTLTSDHYAIRISLELRIISFAARPLAGWNTKEV
ncbi:hypothetical protein Pmani_003157 [Petrolisthes manimaculis]|uniref:Endonuclease/exonuclease/phosphatase domain-containing protein n=1 Tax=Petrolisthes manimaculis TaxID=1843537 RepID=A0AAE1QJ28_9EUCA|nr:hypothetical protein Pmani_003157 [Petrolisthes manimaculis]